MNHCLASGDFLAEPERLTPSPESGACTPGVLCTPEIIEEGVREIKAINCGRGTPNPRTTGKAGSFSCRWC